jgi:hypothetical protein
VNEALAHWGLLGQKQIKIKATIAYVNLLYYKQRSMLHVSATGCGHLQGGL